jgi:hypothetical protein
MEDKRSKTRSLSWGRAKDLSTVVVVWLIHTIDYNTSIIK